MADGPVGPSLPLLVGRFYHDPRGSARAVLDRQLTEAQILVLGMVAVSILLMGRIMRETMTGLSGDALAAKIAAEAVTLLFFVPLFYYGLAALGTLVARACRGTGSWRDGRVGFFWAALVSAPVVVISGLGTLWAGTVAPELGVLVGQVGAAFFAWALAQCFAEAFGFTRTWAVMAILCLPALILFVVIYVTTH